MDLSGRQPKAPPPRSALSRGEVRRLVLMVVGAGIIVLFIGRWVVQQNRMKRDEPEGVQVHPPRDAVVRPPEGLPDGTGIAIPGAEDPDALSGVRDYTDLEVDDPDFLYLIRSVMQQTPQEIAARVDRDVGFEQYFWRPAEHRGRYVRVVGTLDHLEPMWLPRSNPSGVERVWWGSLLTRDRRLIQVIVPEGEKLRVGRDTVEVEGPFYKVRRYVTVRNRTSDFPLVIGRRMRIVPEVTYEEAFPSGLGYLIAALLITLVIVLFVSSRLAARRDAEVDRVHRSRGRGRIARSATPEMPPPPPGGGGGGPSS